MNSGKIRRRIINGGRKRGGGGGPYIRGGRPIMMQKMRVGTPVVLFEFFPFLNLI